MITNVNFDFMQQFNKQEVNIKRLVLDTIFPAFALFLIPNTAIALFCVSEQHDSDSFLNESTV